MVVHPSRQLPQVPRIALVTGGVPAGGSTTFLINFAGELVRRGLPVEVFSLEWDNPMAADFQRQKIPLLCLDQRRQIFEDRLKIILQNLVRFQPTAVVSTLGAISFEPLRYLPAGVFRVGMGQSDDPNVYAMMAHYTPWLDLVAMVSPAMKFRAEAMPEFARVPVAYLSYGVPMCPDSELPVRDFQRPLRILYLGRLCHEQKRVRLFPEIYAQLCASGIPFHWTIAGEGEDRSWLEERLKSVSPSQTVSFAGWVNYSEVPTVLKQHDVSLLTSDYEGFGLSVAESMGYGLVPVASDLPAGIPEMVDPTTGMLVPVNDVVGYARAIIHLHEHRDELAAKSTAARARVKKKFSVEAMTDGWLAQFPVQTPVTDWPKKWRIKIPLTAKNPFYFTQPVRWLRRQAIGIKSEKF